MAGMWAIILDWGICPQQHHRGVLVIGINPTSPVPKTTILSKARGELLLAKTFFQNRLIYRDRVVLSCWVSTSAPGRKSQLGGEIHRFFAEVTRVLDGVCRRAMPTRRYANALAEAGIGQTCAVDMQPADACVVSFRRDLCVAKKTVTFMELLWWF